MWSWVLAFLRDEGNRGILTFLGGGAVVGGGLWTAFTFFAEKPGEKPSFPSSSTSIVEQKGIGFASGHDINIQAPVTINPDAREVAQQVAAPISHTCRTGSGVPQVPDVPGANRRFGVAPTTAV